MFFNPQNRFKSRFIPFYSLTKFVFRVQTQQKMKPYKGEKYNCHKYKPMKEIV